MHEEIMEGKLLFAAKRRWMLLLALLVIVIVGGMRFSDGTMLLAISQGATVEHAVFQNAATHYVWDSPLKVYILWALPSSILIIAAAFALIGALPSLYFLQRDPRILFIASAVLLITPAFKISIQNLGVGDGLMIALVIFVCVTKSKTAIFSCLLALGLWHPQQAFFIGLSWAAGQFLYEDRVQLGSIASGLLALCTAALWFFYYKASLGFKYADRSDYMANHLSDLIIPNLTWAVVAFLPIILWFAWLAPKAKWEWALIFWLGVLAFISLLTTDVTRVFTLISLPLIAIGASKLYETQLSNGTESGAINSRLIAMFVAVLLLPPYSWSGLDFFLWGDLISDFCKWGVYCAR